MPFNVAVLGQGYVGLPLAMEAVKAGHNVVGLDTDQNKIDKLNDGESYIEDVPSDLVLDAIQKSWYKAVLAETVYPEDNEDALDGFDVAVITVPTPLKDGRPDLSYVKSAADIIGHFLEADRLESMRQLVVLESTTYPGTTEEVVIPILEEVSGFKAGKDFHVGFSPERIDPGNKRWNFRNTTKVVSGLTEECLARTTDFYSTIVDQVHQAKTLKAAEMAKIVENTFRHVNIALVNELGRLSHGLGVDLWDALDAANSKPFGFMKFTPGPGVGGHCLPIDPLYLADRVKRELGVPSRFIDLAQDVNDHQPDYVVQRLTCGLNSRGKSVKGSKVLVLGVTYKPGTSDLRETPATRIVKLLDELEASVFLVDPHAAGGAFEGHHVYSISPLRTEDYDAVLIVTPHEEFLKNDHDLDAIVSKAKYVLDTRNVVEGAHANVETL